MGRRAKEVIEEEQIDPNEKRSEDIAGEILKKYKDDHYNGYEEIDYNISFGSLKVDKFLGGGLGPGFHRFCGHNNSGKTPAALLVQSNFLKYHAANKKRAKGIYVRAEGRLSKENMARSGAKYVFSHEEWKDGTVLVLNCQQYEVIAEFVFNLIASREDILFHIIIDSMDGLKVRVDEDKMYDQNAKVAGAPALSKRFLRDTSLGVNVKGHQSILISQVAADIKIDPQSRPHPKDGDFSGGNALSHFANCTLEFHKFYVSDLILDPPYPKGKVTDPDTKVLGHNCKITIRKSTNEKNHQQVEYKIKHDQTNGTSIWREFEIIDCMWIYGYLEGKTWLNISPILLKNLKEHGLEMPEKINGETKLRIFLEENQPITDYLFEFFRGGESCLFK